MSAIRPRSSYKEVSLHDGVYDSFGQIRTSNPVTLFDSQQQYGESPLLWETALTGSGTTTHAPNESAVRMNTTSASGDKVVRQTRQYHRYQPGKSLKIAVTGQVASDMNDRRFRCGYFDAQNGIFLEVVGSNAFIVKRSHVSGTTVDTRVAQADWSEDKFDGNGQTKIELDITKSFIFVIDLEWLGVGTVRAGFQIDGKPYYAHEFHHANIGSTTYMTTANLPVRYELENTAATDGSDYATAICAVVISEGGFEDERGFPFAAERSAKKSITTEVPILSIRPALQINGITNRAQINIEQLSLYSEDAPAIFRAYYGGALTNASFSVYNATHSGVEVDEAATALSGGLRVGPAVVLPASSQGQNSNPSSNTGSLLSRLPITLAIDGTHPTTPFSDIITITAESLDGVTATDVFASASWREVY